MLTSVSTLWKERNRNVLDNTKKQKQKQKNKRPGQAINHLHIISRSGLKCTNEICPQSMIDY